MVPSKVAGHPEACWLADWAEEAALEQSVMTCAEDAVQVFSTGGPQHNLAPQPSSALLRSVFAALQRAQDSLSPERDLVQTLMYVMLLVFMVDTVP